MASLRDAIVIIDRDCIIKFVNKSLLDITGYREEEILGQHLNKITPGWARKFHSPSGAKSVRMKGLERKVCPMSYREGDQSGIVGCTNEIELLTKNNEKLQIYQRVSYVANQGNEYYIGILSDREALAQALRSIEMNTHTMAHDIKASVASSLLSLTALKDFFGELFENDADAKEQLENSIIQIEKTKEIIDTIRQIAKARENLDIEAVSIQAILESFRAAFDRIDEMVIPDSIPSNSCKGNADAIAVCLMNIANNAFKYNNNVKPRVELDIRRSGKKLEFSISDNGEGIPKEFLEKRIWAAGTSSRVSQSGKEGTGLGLHSVKEMTEIMGGSISVISTVGHGSRFTLSFKLVG